VQNAQPLLSHQIHKLGASRCMCPARGESGRAGFAISEAAESTGHFTKVYTIKLGPEWSIQLSQEQRASPLTGGAIAWGFQRAAESQLCEAFGIIAAPCLSSREKISIFDYTKATSSTKAHPLESCVTHMMTRSSKLPSYTSLVHGSVASRDLHLAHEAQELPNL
jgi:hypothetical protein